MSTAHSTATQTYQVDYDGSFNQGSYAEAGYDAHGASARYTADVGNRALFRVFGRYYVRLPGTTRPSTPLRRHSTSAPGSRSGQPGPTRIPTTPTAGCS